LQQGDLILGLLNLLERNRLALVVLAASFTSGARIRARGAYTDSTAARWLARNARLVRHFLHSLSLLRRCAGKAGYRALSRAQPIRRLYASPRLLVSAAPARALLAAPVVRRVGRIQSAAVPARC
jgi:hypothetical protein